MKRCYSKSSYKKVSSAFQRIYSEDNLKKVAIPEFLKNSYSIQDLLDEIESPEKSPLKPKILQKYSKDLRDSNRCSNFEDFSKYLTTSENDQIALVIHNHEILVSELKCLLHGQSISRNLIDCTLSVIKRKNRELTRRSDDYSRVLIGKTSFTDKLFSGQSVSSRNNLLKFEFILFPLQCKNNKWNLIVLDNKNLKVIFYNYSKIENTENIFNRIKTFISFQLIAEGKNWADTPYLQLMFQCVNDARVEEDTGILMLLQALGIATCSQSVLVGRGVILELLYNYGRV